MIAEATAAGARNPSTIEDAEDFTEKLIADFACYPDLSLQTAFMLSREQRDRIALTGLRNRFSQLRGKIAVLDHMAKDQGVDEISTIESAAFLLFPHTVYKSYPLAVLERSQFDKLTRWLQGLTVVDLSGFSATGIETIDDWMSALNDQLGLQLVHTSGTTGKLSFLPRVRSDEDQRLKIMLRNFRDWNGPGSGPDLLAQPYPMIYPSYRTGSTAPGRSVMRLADLVARDEQNVLALYPDHFSADIASLAGRLRAAESRGEAGQVHLTSALLARRDEFVRRERERPQRLEQFFAEAQTRFSGRDVFVMGTLPLIYDWAEAGLARGLRGLFGPQSIVQTGGGSKGRDLPADAAERVKAFIGCDEITMTYAMSEMTSICRQCTQGHYHIPPYIVPYVLDADSGEALPRSGRQTGRFGFVDLFPSDHWGGFLTGDKVTISGWDEACACGRTGPYVETPVQRFSELQGGDDKITCAGAPEAHDKAVEFLVAIAQS